MHDDDDLYPDDAEPVDIPPEELAEALAEDEEEEQIQDLISGTVSGTAFGNKDRRIKFIARWN